MKYRRTRLNSEVIYSGKDFICRKTHDKKKEEAKPKLSGEKNVSTKGFRVYRGLRYESTPFVLRQYEGSTPPFGRSKYIPAQTTSRQL